MRACVCLCVCFQSVSQACYCINGHLNAVCLVNIETPPLSRVHQARSTMKHTSRWRQTPPSVTVWVTPSESPHSLQIKRCPQVKRAHSRGSQSPTKRSQRRDERHPVKMIKAPALSLQRQAMAPFFRLFGKSISGKALLTSNLMLEFVFRRQMCPGLPMCGLLLYID